MCIMYVCYDRYGTRGTDDALFGNSEAWGFTPASLMSDEERYHGVTRVPITCLSCENTMEFMGYSGGVSSGTSGLSCTQCGSQLYGRNKDVELYCYLYNKISLVIRQQIKQYYDCWLVCDDRMCNRRTMQQSIRGYQCVNHGCKGRMIPVSVLKKLYVNVIMLSVY